MKKSMSIVMSLLLCGFVFLISPAAQARTNLTSAFGKVAPTDFALSDTVEHVVKAPELGGIVITLKGPETYVTTTDPEGFFEFADILPGDYEISTKSDFFQDVNMGIIVIEDNVANEIPDIPLGSLSFLFAGVNRDGITHFADESLYFMQHYFIDKNKMSVEGTNLIGSNLKKEALKDYISAKGAQLSLTDTFVFFYYGSTFIHPETGTIYLDCADAQILEGKPNFDSLISSAELTSWLNESLINYSRVLIFMEGENSFEFCEQLFKNNRLSMAAVTSAYGNEWYELGGPDIGLMTMAIGAALTKTDDSADLFQRNLIMILPLARSYIRIVFSDLPQQMNMISTSSFSTSIVLYKE